MYYFLPLSPCGPCPPRLPSTNGGIVVVVVDVVVGVVAGMQLSSLHFSSVSTQIQMEHPSTPILISSPSRYHLPSYRHEYAGTSGCGTIGCGTSSGGCLNAIVVPSTFSTLPFVAKFFNHCKFILHKNKYIEEVKAV
jgi:hypothetical protein